METLWILTRSPGHKVKQRWPQPLRRQMNKVPATWDHILIPNPFCRLLSHCGCVLNHLFVYCWRRGEHVSHLWLCGFRVWSFKWSIALSFMWQSTNTQRDFWIPLCSTFSGTQRVRRRISIMTKYAKASIVHKRIWTKILSLLFQIETVVEPMDMNEASKLMPRLFDIGMHNGPPPFVLQNQLVNVSQMKNDKQTSSNH